MQSEALAVCETASVLRLLPEARPIILRCVVSLLCHSEIQSEGQ